MKKDLGEGIILLAIFIILLVAPSMALIILASKSIPIVLAGICCLGFGIVFVVNWVLFILNDESEEVETEER